MESVGHKKIIIFNGGAKNLTRRGEFNQKGFLNIVIW